MDYKGVRQALFLIVTAILLSSCGTSSGSNTKSYADDGYLGLSNANPNLAISPTALTNRRDIELMRQALATVPEVKDARITVNGPHAYVSLSLPEHLSASQVKTVENKAFHLLAMNVPRYTFKVTSGLKSKKIF